MKLSPKTLFSFLLFGTLLFSADSYSAPSPRSDTWQISLVPTFTNSKSIRFDGGAVADINENYGFNLGIGYNFDNHLEMEMDIGSTSTNYTGTRILDDGSSTAEKYNGNLYTSHLNLSLTYNFMTSRFTPFVSGKFGSTFIDSGIPTGDIGTSCWYDPWYGYYCAPYAKTYTSTNFNYGADLGLRFDITRNVFLKGSVGKTYLTLSNTGTPDFTHYRFTVGFSFK